MNCLDKFFGIRGLCADEQFVPRSGLFIENLPGINVKNVAKFTTNFPSAISDINDKINIAGSKIMDDIKRIVYPDLIEKPVIETALGGEFVNLNNSDTNDYHAAENYNKGLRVTKYRTQFSKLRINRLRFLTNTTLLAKDVFIKDGNITHNYKVDLVAGQLSELFIDFVSETEQLDIYWDTSDILPAKGSTYNTQRTSACGCSQGTYDFLTAVGLNNGNETNDLYGISAYIQVECDISRSLCLIADSLKWALLYRTGIELLDEWIVSDKMNYLTLHSKDWAKETRQKWYENEYLPLLESKKETIVNYLKTIDKNCFECGGLRHAYTHP